MADFPYPGKYTFVDVEIPNLFNDCICAISMIVIEDGQEVVRVTEYINPKTFFSPNNIRIHHIRRKDVCNARTLQEFWQDYGKYFEKPYIIGAHNVMSDVSVLNKDLARFHTEIHAEESLDTVDVVEKAYYQGKPKSGDLKLSNIAIKLGIPLEHHNPESDVNACYEVIRYMHDKKDLDLTPFIKPIGKTRFKPSKHKMSTSQIRTFYKQTKREIAKQSQWTKVSMEEAKARGDEAMEWKDYEGAIFYYEVAISKQWPTSSVYLKLAKIYEEFNLNYEAVQVLEKGIQILKKNHQSWYDLLSRQKKVSKKIRERKQQRKAQQAKSPAPDSSLPLSPSPAFEKPSGAVKAEQVKASTSRSLKRPKSKKNDSVEKGQTNPSSLRFLRFSKKGSRDKGNQESRLKQNGRTQRVLQTVREVFHFPKKKAQ